MVFDTLLESVVIINAERKILYCNEVFSTLCDVPLKRLLSGKKFEEFIVFSDAHFWDGGLDLPSLTDPTPYKEVSFTSKSGKTGIIQVSIQPLPVELSLMTTPERQFIMFFHDVTLEEKLQMKYREELHQKEGMIQNLDRKLFEVTFLLGLSRATASGTTTQNFVSSVLENLLDTFKFSFGSMINILSKDGIESIKIDTIKLAKGLASKEGEDVRKFEKFKGLLQTLTESCVQVLAKEIPVEQDFGENRVLIIPLIGKSGVPRLFILASDLDRKLLEQSDIELIAAASTQVALTIDNMELYQRSITDEMTTLFNNRYFHHRLDSEIQRAMRSKEEFGLLLLDVDHFKKFNDTYGHQTGDLVLKKVAEAIKQGCRTTDIPARYGGEEFTVILIKTDREGAKVAAERIRKSIENMRLETAEFGVLKVTASVGISMFPVHSTVEKDLIECADKALYKAKAAGRNNSQVGEPLTDSAE